MKELEVINEQKVLGKEFKIYGDLENPLFLAKDVADWIEHSSITMMLKSIDEEEKVKIRPKQSLGVLTSNNEYWFLTEDGLYEVLMQSRKPIAKQFKKKVKEILKALRKGEIAIVPNNQQPSYMIEDRIARAERWIEEQRETQRLALENETLNNKIEEDKPKVEIYETFLDAEGTYTVTEICAIFKLNRKEVFKELRNKGLIYKQQAKATKKGIELGYFKQVDKHGYSSLVVTPKGVEFIKNIFNL